VTLKILNRTFVLNYSTKIFIDLLFFNFSVPQYNYNRQFNQPQFGQSSANAGASSGSFNQGFPAAGFGVNPYAVQQQYLNALNQGAQFVGQIANNVLGGILGGGMRPNNNGYYPQGQFNGNQGGFYNPNFNNPQYPNQPNFNNQPNYNNNNPNNFPNNPNNLNRPQPPVNPTPDNINSNIAPPVTNRPRPNRPNRPPPPIINPPNSNNQGPTIAPTPPAILPPGK
jgi:hypothetical protein